MHVLVVLVLLLATPYQTQPHISTKQPAIQKGDAQSEAADKQQQSPNVSIDECNGCFEVEKPHTKAEKKDTYNAREDTLYRAYLLFTVLGVFGGLFGLRVIYKQSKANEIAAFAAKASADALVASERAWILVLMPDVPVEMTKPDPYGLYWIRPIIRNKGKTIARINRIRAVVRLNNDGELLPPKPEYPEGQGADIKGVNIMLPPEVFIQPIKLPATGEELTQVQRTERFLYVHGFVVYQDFSGKERRTDFCYYYAVQSGFTLEPTSFHLEITAPPGYNEST
jgi:hypothetical protein